MNEKAPDTSQQNEAALSGIPDLGRLPLRDILALDSDNGSVLSNAMQRVVKEPDQPLRYSAFGNAPIPQNSQPQD